MQLRYSSDPSDDENTPLSDLSDILDEARIHCGIPGMSVAVLYKGKLIFAEGFGKRNDYDPFTAETLVPVASITKSFTAAAIGELVAEGKMDWDTTPVSKYLPDFELYDRHLTDTLTIVDLLSHRTNFPTLDIASFRTTESRQGFMRRMKHVKVDAKLRVEAEYNNVMYGVAGEAAAAVAGMSYEDLVRTKILEPLQLTNSGFNPIEMRNRGPNHAIPYTADSFEDARKGKFIKGYLDEIPMVDAASGDLFSNVFDLARWGRVHIQSGMVDGKQVLNKDSIDETKRGYSFLKRKRRSPEFSPTEVSGLGWILDSYKGQINYQHSGSIPGFRSNLAIFPDSDLVVVCLTNAHIAELPVNLPYYIVDELLGLPKTQNWLFETSVKEAKERYAGDAMSIKGTYPRQVEGTLTMHSLQDYVGQYQNPYYGDVSIRLVKDKDSGNEQLYIKMNAFDSKMIHHHFDTFRILFHDFAIKMASSGTFQTGADGRVSGIQLQLPAAVDFTRREAGTRKA
ncbi:beta-lactamase/transpeptidase-like protein [Mortierella sp. GBAus27b]|nr:beta-lactamase/transpeptidase-like protein [Mortierella sp. GBAus27b]